MKVIPNDDFSYSLSFKSGLKMEVRDLKGKDLYYTTLMQRDFPEKVEKPIYLVELIAKLSNVSTNEILDLEGWEYRKLLIWFQETILNGKLMLLDDWLTLCFHLMKQRWTSDLDWLEEQPLTKVIRMSDIQTDFHDKVNQEMKRK